MILPLLLRPENYTNSRNHYRVLPSLQRTTFEHKNTSLEIHLSNFDENFRNSSFIREYFR